ncbi:hypothetical protein WA026_015404 [Henosepilachna vigintioctopunctata]|uniref:Uncharacterized protein n=1 Tax=Henosepilachna vigintioctopunctata TaxID=420089 RepID=A0AAW1UN95_9CUCU
MLMRKTDGELIAQSADHLAQNGPLAESNEKQISEPTNDLVPNVQHENNALGNSSQPSCSRNYKSVQPLVETDESRTPLTCLRIQNMESP